MTAYREPVAVAAAPVTTRRMVRVVGATPNLVSIAIDGDSQFELTPDRLWLS